MTRSEVVHLAIGAVVLLAVTAAVLRAARVPLGWSPYVAVARGAAQLAVISLALKGVFAAPPTAAAVLAVMAFTATWTASRRVRTFERSTRAVVVACLGGAAVALLVVFGTAVLPFQARYVVALGGIVLGGCMTSATIAGRQLRAGLVARRDEVEAWLSVGATNRQAVADIGRRAAAEALVPAVDQTRTTGLVTLPGAFIGALLAGASTAQAARFQIVVLVALLCAEAIVAVLLTYLLGAPRVLPEGPDPTGSTRRTRNREKVTGIPRR